MRKILLLIALISSPAFAGNQLVDKLKEKGFTCTTNADGSVCKISRVDSPGFKYSQPMMILIPPNVQKPSDLLVHLHGHNMGGARDSTPEAMLKDFDMQKQLQKSGARNSVMIFPFSKGKCDNFKSELAPQFDKFMSWVKATVEPAGDHYTLSGHSGAYIPIGQILENQSKKNPDLIKKLDSVVLLDSTYPSTAQSQAWFGNSFKSARSVNPNFSVYSVYRENGGTKSGSLALKNALDGNNVQIIRSETDDHYAVVNTYYADLIKDGRRQLTGAAAAPARR